MEKLIGILEELHPDVDFATAHDLLTSGVLVSFDVVMLITRIEEVFGVAIPAKYITPATFDSASSLYACIEQLADD